MVMWKVARSGLIVRRSPFVVQVKYGRLPVSRCGSEASSQKSVIESIWSSVFLRTSSGGLANTPLPGSDVAQSARTPRGNRPMIRGYSRAPMIPASHLPY
jgi:hypothetical protein